MGIRTGVHDCTAQFSNRYRWHKHNLVSGWLCQRRRYALEFDGDLLPGRSNAEPNAHPVTNGYTHAYGNYNTNRDCNSNGYTDGNAHPMCGMYSSAAPHTGSTPVAVRASKPSRYATVYSSASTIIPTAPKHSMKTTPQGFASRLAPWKHKFTELATAPLPLLISFSLDGFSHGRAWTRRS